MISDDDDDDDDDDTPKLKNCLFFSTMKLNAFFSTCHLM